MSAADDPAVLEVRRRTLAAKLGDLHAAEERTYAELVLVEHRLRRVNQPQRTDPPRTATERRDGVTR
jgi:hypothetical protein